MKKSILLKFALILSSALFLSSCSDDPQNTGSKVITAETIDPIEEELLKADENTLVVFDCDDVLITSTDQIMKKNNRKLFKKLRKKLNLRHTEAILFALKNRLVNDKLPSIISNLQSRNIKTVVLTGFSATPFEKLGSPAQWRASTLNDLNYHFEKSWPGLEEKHFEEFDLKYDPFYYKGIIFCGDVSKDKCLDAFIKYADIKPTKIIFIDDGMKNVRDIEKFCNFVKIKYVGIEYLEAKKIVSELPLSLKKATFQFETFKNKGIWLSDEEAEKELNL